MPAQKVLDGGRFVGLGVGVLGLSEHDRCGAARDLRGHHLVGPEDDTLDGDGLLDAAERHS